MMSGTINQARAVLKQVFGYTAFRPLQAEIIASVLKKKDALVILPTGGGKSLCYQIPALLFSGLTVVVSPLIALMKDQVEQMQHLGVSAVMLNSALEPAAYRRNVARVASGAVRLLYVAPETLMMSRTMDLLTAIPVDCLAIDEAHCISEWGHDFRPEYRQLVQTREKFPGAVCMALTATATPRVRRDIQTTLGFNSTATFIGSFNRENLFLQILPKNNPLAQIRRMLKKYPRQSGIIYCATRRQVDELAQALMEDGVQALPYHAGLGGSERKVNQERFIRDDTRIMVATIAFGMGIDKPDVRFVIHYDLPKNIESYYQEIGRAGRDGLPADCLLLFSYADIYKIKHFIQQKAESERRAAAVHLNALLRFIEGQGCRRVPLLQYFGETPVAESCGRCDNCRRGEREQIDLTISAQKFLSCVYRTGQRFGAAHVINVLLGSKARRVIELSHHRLSTHGIGRDLSRGQWQALSRQLVHGGLLIEDMDYGGFRLGPRAWDVLKGREKVMGWLDNTGAPGIGATEPSAAKTRPKRDLPDYNRDLFELLREKRKQIADRESVPPYIVFADKTLMEMAAYFPQTEAGLAGIHGVGRIKLAAYGPEFLETILQYCREQGLSEKAGLASGPVSGPPAAPVEKDPAGRVKKKRHEVVGETFNAGRTVVEIMEMFSIKRETVLDHLYRYWCEGHALASEHMGFPLGLTREQRERGFAAFEKYGLRRLKPVFDALGGEVRYPDLTVLRLMFIARNGLTAPKHLFA